MIFCKIVSVQQGIRRAAEGKVTIVEQHEDRLFFFSVLRADPDIQVETVFTLPVMRQDCPFMFHLYGGRSEMDSFIYGIR